MIQEEGSGHPERKRVTRPTSRSRNKSSLSKNYQTPLQTTSYDYQQMLRIVDVLMCVSKLDIRYAIYPLFEGWRLHSYSQSHVRANHYPWFILIGFWDIQRRGSLHLQFYPNSRFANGQESACRTQHHLNSTYPSTARNARTLDSRRNDKHVEQHSPRFNFPRNRYV